MADQKFTITSWLGACGPGPEMWLWPESGEEPQDANKSESQGHSHQQVPGNSLAKHPAQHELLTAMS